MRARRRKADQRRALSRNEETYLLTDSSPFAVQEAYKALRTNLIFSAAGEQCKRILITSSFQGEAKSTTAVNLGIAFAQNKSKILLTDCDFRMPTGALKLNVNEEPGLTEVLIGMSRVEDAIQHLPMGLDFLPAGTIPPNPTELLGSEQMNRLLERLAGSYEYIIMDTPPVNTVSDATILAKLATGVVIVARQEVSTQESIDEILKKLKFAEAKILGFVFTGVANEKQRSYRKGYGYGYGYGYGRPPKKNDESN